MASQTRPWGRIILLVVFVLATGAAAGWAVATVMRPAEDPLEAATFTYATVEEGEVGSSVSLTATAAWSTHQSGTNQAGGVVTTVEAVPGTEVVQGDVLYSVGLRPVVIAQGAVPSFRPIARGVSGDDVMQLQVMLASLGFYGGPADGKAEGGTESAIKEWQDSHGLEPTGIVEIGDVIFVPDLPSRVTLNTEVIARGGILSGGEPVVESLPSAPFFNLPVTESQAALIPAGTRVEITSPEGTLWNAYSVDQSLDPESQTVTVALEGEDGGSICLTLCDQIPIAGQSTLTAKAITTESVTGLTVPSAALISTGQSDTALIDETGVEIPVTIVASSRGMSVVEGIDPGVRVRIPNVDGGNS